MVASWNMEDKSDSKAVQADDASGTICVWRLNKVIDVKTNGNYMNYEYNTTTGLISKILYTGSQSFSPYNEIEFIYESRGDPNLIYPGYSAPVTDNKLLTEIRVKCNGTVVKKYKFYYEREDEDIYSLLNEIKETDGADVALNSTVIGYRKARSCFRVKFSRVESDVVLYGAHWGDFFCSAESNYKKGEMGVTCKWTSLLFFGGNMEPCAISLSLFSNGDVFKNGIIHSSDRIPSQFRTQDLLIIRIIASLLLSMRRAKLLSNPWDWNEMYGDYNGDDYLDVFKARILLINRRGPQKFSGRYIYTIRLMKTLIMPLRAKRPGHNYQSRLYVE